MKVHTELTVSSWFDGTHMMLKINIMSLKSIYKRRDEKEVPKQKICRQNKIIQLLFYKTFNTIVYTECNTDIKGRNKYEM